MSKEPIVPLNQVIGHHLLSFLEGIDAVNFLAAVDDSEQFGSTAQTSDYAFLQSIKVFRGHGKLFLCRALFEIYQDNYDLDENRWVLVPKHYSPFMQPRVRLFVHPCFSVDGFRILTKCYKTPLFECYCRLLSFNTAIYGADFGLLNYESHIHTALPARTLNNHENKLFKSKFDMAHLMIKILYGILS